VRFCAFHLYKIATMKYILFFNVLFLTFLFSCKQETYKEGATLYKKNCANCHQENGEGLGELIPPLAKADYLQLYRPKLACVLKKGLTTPIIVNGKTYSEQQMPAMPQLTEVDILNILNFIGSSWGNQMPVFTIDEVKKSLQSCK
jgi:mono/diheme cytochrome c family protein